MGKKAVSLGAEDWVEAANEALASGGVDAVRVEPLAEGLGVTKGSFYWHFADRGALLDAVLTSWERRATAAIIELVDARHETPRARLKGLLDVTQMPAAGARIEHAIRVWGARDAAIQRRLAKIDVTRERYVRELLVASGLEKTLAETRARILYLVLIGEFTWVSHGGAASNAAFREELFTLVTAKR